MIPATVHLELTWPDGETLADGDVEIQGYIVNDDLEIGDELYVVGPGAWAGVRPLSEIPKDHWLHAPAKGALQAHVLADREHYHAELEEARTAAAADHLVDLWRER